MQVSNKMRNCIKEMKTECRIELLCMPFGELSYPSFALTQIKGTLKKRFQDRISVHIRYVNHIFAEYIGADAYRTINDIGSKKSNGLELDNVTLGLKEWLFRDLLFDLDENTEDFLTGFLRLNEDRKKSVLSIQEKLPQFIELCIDEFKLHQAHIVGFCSMFEQHAASLAMCKAIKKRNQSVLTVLGGAKCTDPASKVWIKEVDSLDYSVSGPGLKAMVAIVEAYLKDDMEQTDRIPGVFSRRNLNSQLNNIGDDDNLCNATVLDYQEYFDSLERHLREFSLKPVLFFETSKGCWWAEKNRCVFCDVNGYQDKYSIMPAKTAQRYLETLMQNKCCMFWATDSTIPLEFLDTVFPALRKHTNGKKLFYEVRADMKKSEIMKLYKNNIRYVQAGVESLSSHTLNKINKGVSCPQNLLFLRYCTEIGVHVLWNILSGIPGERDEDLECYLQMIPNIVHLSPPSGIWSVSYQRNSVYFLNPDKYGLNLSAKTIPDEYVYPFSKPHLEDISYIFKNENDADIYTRKRLKQIQKISNSITRWKQLWIDADRPPQLYVCGKKIYDSRYGSLKTYKINILEYKILKAISEKGCSKQELLSIVFTDSVTLNRILNVFCLQWFVYMEGDCYYSLVCINMPKLNQAFIPETIDDILQLEN